MEHITAAQVRHGDVVQHVRRQWPAQTVTAVTEHYGRLTFELSGGSRVSGVAPSAPFLRYAPGETGRMSTLGEIVREQQAIGEAIERMDALS